MSLAARIHIVPSRRLAAFGATIAAGAVALPLVTLAAWVDRESIAGLSLAAALGGVLLGWRVYRRALCSVSFELLLSGSGGIDLVPDRNLADDVAPHAGYRLASGSVAWPGFSVLALTPADSITTAMRNQGRVRVPIVRSELATEDGRALHRFMLWSLRGGAGAGQPNDPTGA